jgi:hypothetical protein
VERVKYHARKMLVNIDRAGMSHYQLEQNLEGVEKTSRKEKVCALSCLKFFSDSMTIPQRRSHGSLSTPYPQSVSPNISRSHWYDRHPWASLYLQQFETL